MNKEQPITVQIQTLFRTNTVLTIADLCARLGRGRSTIFKDLQQIPTCVSYTHAGKYHTLLSTPAYSGEGLWFYGDIAFSKFGTLRETIIHLIESSEIGHTPKELNELLRIQCFNTLTQLNNSKLITRRLLENNRYVYLHQSSQHSQSQYDARTSIDSHEVLHICAPEQSLAIDVLAEVIRHESVSADEKVIFNALVARGKAMTLEGVVSVFDFYQIKKKRN